MPNLPKISLTRNQTIMVLGTIVLIVVVFITFKFFGSKNPTGPAVNLSVWGVDSVDAMDSIISGYETVRPNVTVTYKRVAADEYDEAVLTALATGKGPDVFLIGNHDLYSRGQLLAAATPAQVSLSGVQASFPQAVVQDFVYGDAAYALPLYMDTLTLLYNKQMFDQAGIATPPKTWQEVVDMVPRLRTTDEGGQITRAAIAIGGSDQSVDHAADILNLIMLQNGAVLANDEAKPSFGRTKEGVAAFRFYLQFADAASPAYTWNDLMGSSLEAFASQKTAMVLAYQRDLAEIEERAPFLDFGVAPAPQTSLDRAVNYPSYHGLAVWTGSRVQTWGWDFALFATTNSAAQGGYLAATGRPAALRSLITLQQKDPALAVFANAALTARSWKMGDYDKIKNIFSTAIQNVQTGAKTPDIALSDAETQASQLINR